MIVQIYTWRFLCVKLVTQHPAGAAAYSTLIYPSGFQFSESCPGMLSRVLCVILSAWSFFLPFFWSNQVVCLYL
jgi:hypothetical protein